MLSLTAMEDSVHQGCGRPIAESFDTNNEGAYDIVTHTCQACAAIQNKTSGDNPEVKLAAGQYAVPVLAYDWKTDKEIPVAERF